MKSKFEWRCDGFDRMGMAGVHSIGMGVLIGLEKEWRTDVVMMAHHLRYLQKHYWKTKYSVNFPRMRPAQNEGFQPNCFMTDKQLAQATFAMRIFDHDVDISYSTREPAYIRDNMATLGVTTMSAESKVNPGGYHTYPQALEQFTVSDERTAKVINARLKELGREPVWKDWDASFDFSEISQTDKEDVIKQNKKRVYHKFMTHSFLLIFSDRRPFIAPSPSATYQPIPQNHQ